MRKGLESVPMFVRTFNDLLPHLEVLMHTYQVTMITEALESQDAGTEMLLNVGRKFNNLFRRQSQYNALPRYDLNVENMIPEPTASKNGGGATGGDGEGGSTGGGLFDLEEEDFLQSITSETPRLQKSGWLPYVKVVGEADPERSAVYHALSAIKADGTLEVENHFTKSDNLKNVDVRLKEVRLDGGAMGLASNGGEKMFKRIYDQKGSASGRSSIPAEAMPLRTHVQAFAQMRYLRVRDMKREVLDSLNYMRSVQRTLTIDQMGFARRQAKPKQHVDNYKRIGGEDIYVNDAKITVNEDGSDGGDKLNGASFGDFLVDRKEFSKSEGP